MPLHLPTPIEAYFTADREKSRTIEQYFTENAVVIDEGHTHQGRAAIARWKENASQKYNYISEPFAIAQEGEHIIVTSHVRGDFPGSPVNLRYSFVLADDAIAHLEITL
ncbi:nuclear transport factor 2 family protein [Brucellaceae bacterium D45D]